ncbi:MAG: hypothetical protein Q9218_004588 [Villophora microphyllina]
MPREGTGNPVRRKPNILLTNNGTPFLKSFLSIGFPGKEIHHGKELSDVRSSVILDIRVGNKTYIQSFFLFRPKDLEKFISWLWSDEKCCIWDLSLEFHPNREPEGALRKKVYEAFMTVHGLSKSNVKVKGFLPAEQGVVLRQQMTREPEYFRERVPMVTAIRLRADLLFTSRNWKMCDAVSNYEKTLEAYDRVAKVLQAARLLKFDTDEGNTDREQLEGERLKLKCDMNYVKACKPLGQVTQDNHIIALSKDDEDIEPLLKEVETEMQSGKKFPNDAKARAWQNICFMNLEMGNLCKATYAIEVAGRLLPDNREIVKLIEELRERRDNHLEFEAAVEAENREAARLEDVSSDEEDDAGEDDASEDDIGEDDAEEGDAGKADAGKADVGKYDAEGDIAGQDAAGEDDAKGDDAEEDDAREDDAGEEDTGEKDAGGVDAGEDAAGEDDTNRGDEYFRMNEPDEMAKRTKEIEKEWPGMMKHIGWTDTRDKFAIASIYGKVDLKAIQPKEVEEPKKAEEPKEVEETGED